MPQDVTRLLQEIATATNAEELTAIAAAIEKADFDELALAQLTDALREARERLCK